MNTDSYVQSGETIYCRTQTKLGGTEDSDDGELVCTDSRLLFLDNSSVIDLDIQSIQEIEYHERYLPWKYILAGLALILIGSVIGFAGSNIAELPFEAVAFLTLLLVAGGLGALGDAYLLWKPTLFISTSRKTRRFRGGSLQDFPHAIRGASN